MKQNPRSEVWIFRHHHSAELQVRIQYEHHVFELTLIQPASRVHKLYQRLWVSKWTKSCSHSSTSCIQLSKFRRRPHPAHHISVTNTTHVGITHSAGVLPSSSPNYKHSAIYTLGSQREVVIMAKDTQRGHSFFELPMVQLHTSIILVSCPIYLLPKLCSPNAEKAELRNTTL